MSSKILFKISPVYSKCPSCSNYDVLRRSTSRNILEHLVNHGTFFRVYRCKNCGWRGYLSTLTITSRSIKSLLFYLLLGVITAIIAREILKRFL